MAQAVPVATYCGLECLGSIGKGAFGSVHLVQNEDGDQFAVKVMEMCQASPSDRKVARNEVTVLRLLKHEHVVIYVESLSHEGKLYVVTEVCSGGDLNGFLERMTSPVPENLLLVWLWQIACGLEYMHSFGPTPILHRDLKPSNIYLTEEGIIRLGDMGIARILETPDALAETFCGSPSYMSPEVLFDIPYNAKTDIWSLGCVVAKMLTLQTAYRGSSLDVLRAAVLRGPPDVPEGVNNDLRRLLTAMLTIEFWKRPTATDILDQRILQHCEDMQPFPLLYDYNLTDNLGIRLDRSPSSSVMSLSRSSTHTPPPTLHLNQGEKPVSEYHEKRRTRTHGRQETFSETKKEGTFSKTKKKVLVTVRERDQSRTLVPEKQESPGDGGDADDVAAAAAAAGSASGGDAATAAAATAAARQDVSLSSRLLKSFTSSVSALHSRPLTPKPRGGSAYQPVLDERDPHDGYGSFSPMAQITILKSILMDILGEDKWKEACYLITTVQSSTELQAKLASLLGDLEIPSQVIMYCAITESIRTNPPGNRTESPSLHHSARCSQSRH